jgi:hypothetical protein
MILAAAAIAASSCGIRKPQTQPTEKVIYTYKDSLVIKDSIKTVILPVERVKDIVPIYDTLFMETSLSEAKTWLDTTNHMLRGELKNKPVAKIPVPVTEHTVSRDSLVYKEVPVEVEVPVEKTKYPTLFWVLLAFAIMVIGKNVPKLVSVVKWLFKFNWKKLLFWKKNKKNPGI